MTQDAAPAMTDKDIIVRQVTGWQATFIARGPGEPGVYTFQLIMDQGAAEEVLTLNDDDADNMFDWLSASNTVFFDHNRKALMFGPRTLGS